MRYRRIEVKYQDLDGKLRKEKLYDNDAVAVQHELDHLEGILSVSYTHLTYGNSNNSSHTNIHIYNTLFAWITLIREKR